MQKKIIMLLCFVTGGACLISAGLYINRQQAGLTEEYVTETVSKTKSPELLSEINMTAYVSLPASFSDIEIVEDFDDIEVTEENVDEVMYDYLFRTATRASALTENGKTIVADYTVTQDNEVKEVRNNSVLGYDSNSALYSADVYNGLNGAETGENIHMEGVTFDGFENAILDITIENIYNMPYPVTDDYVSEHTSYSSVFGMQTALIQDASGEARTLAREHTINTLIDTMMDQTTFIRLPESLIMKELKALQKDEPNATYEEAKHSLYKIFFLAAVIDHYDVATRTDMEKRYSRLDESEKEGLTEYEMERKKYLLFEEDVILCIYKKVVITDAA